MGTSRTVSAGAHMPDVFRNLRKGAAKKADLVLTRQDGGGGGGRRRETQDVRCGRATYEVPQTQAHTQLEPKVIMRKPTTGSLRRRALTNCTRSFAILWDV